MTLQSAVVLLTCAVATAQVDGGKENKVRPSTVCEILSRPLQFDGRFIQVRDRLDGTDEGSWFVGDDCPAVLVTDEHVWPSAISLTAPQPRGYSLGLYLHQVMFEFDFESQRKLDSKYRALRRNIPDRCLMWTFSGVFETRQDWSRAKVNYPNGTWKYFGFGHLSEAPGQLLIKSADGVEAIPNCGTDKKRKH